MQNLHPKSIWLFFFQYLGVGLGITVFLGWFGGLYLFQLASKSTTSAILLIILFFVFWIMFSYIAAKLSYNAYKYELADNAFKKEHGVIWKKYISIPYERIQNVDIHRGILARILGLSDLMIQTAGYTGGGGRSGIGREPEGRLPGIGKELAEQLREELVIRAKGMKSGV
ncbi:MAG: PH domain-containing protein [Candidatus Nealsonbacteria bacterium]